jgi:soluble P-type ATPase
VRALLKNLAMSYHVRDACCGDKVTDVFDLRETKLGFLEVESDVLSAKALEYSSNVNYFLLIPVVH